MNPGTGLEDVLNGRSSIGRLGRCLRAGFLISVVGGRIGSSGSGVSVELGLTALVVRSHWSELGTRSLPRFLGICWYGG